MPVEQALGLLDHVVGADLAAQVQTMVGAQQILRSRGLNRRWAITPARSSSRPRTG
jgi:hypothetical protein